MRSNIKFNDLLSLQKILNVTDCDNKDCKYRGCCCCQKCSRNKALEIKDCYVKK